MTYEMYPAPSRMSVSEDAAHSPVPTDGTGDFYRVMVKRSKHNLGWSIDIGEHYKKSFTLYCYGDPPTCVMEKLAMIGALGYEWEEIDLSNPFALQVGFHALHLPRDDIARDIGWRLGENLFVVILSKDDLLSLRGIALDSGSESKSES